MEIEMVEIGRDTGGTPQVTQWKRICLQMQEMQGTKFQSLGWEDPLEKGNATHSSILAWRIPWMYSPWGRKESDTTERLSLSYNFE